MIQYYRIFALPCHKECLIRVKYSPGNQRQRGNDEQHFTSKVCIFSINASKTIYESMQSTFVSCPSMHLEQ